MSAPDLSLLANRRFGPLFVVQFLGAFNDNVLKFALLFLANFTLYAHQPDKAELLAVATTGVFILPYFLFSSIAGQIADAWDKARLVRVIKAAEVAIMALGLAGFWFQSLPALMVALFLMGCHSTIFGPVKYSILPQHLVPGQIMGATGLIEAGTFLAILGGQLLGGLLPPWEAGLAAMGLSLVGLAAAFAIPAAPATAPGLKIELNVFRGTWHILKAAQAGRGLWLCILGISWFFAVGAVILSEFAPLVSGVLEAQKGVVTLFLLTFSISIALGSMVVNRMLGGEVSARYVPVSALAMAGFLITLWLSTSGYDVAVSGANTMTFVKSAGAIPILVSLAGLAFAGGMFIVPLYAILQTYSPPEARSQIIAANNIVNAVVTVAMVAIVGVLLARGTDIPGIIGVLGFATLAVALISCLLLPETLIKSLLRRALELLYRVELRGAENMPREGERAVVVVNHVSYLDGLLLAVFLPGKPVFAVHTKIASAWWMQPALKLFEAFPVDPTNPMSAKAMVKAVRGNRTLVIFPEGRITVTGALMKIFDGPGMVADKADAPIIPVRIDGAQFTPFSLLRGKLRLRWFPKITLTILPQRRFAIGEGGSARERRAIAGRRLYDEMAQMIFATSDIERTLFQALLDARRNHGSKARIVEDIKRTPLTYQGLVTGAIVLGRVFGRTTAKGEAVGLLLPNVNSVVAAFFALQAIGRVPAMLNYTAGLKNLEAATTTANIRTIITARAFVEQAKLGDTVAALEASGKTIIWLEEVAAGIGLWQKLGALVARRFARGTHDRLGIQPNDPAVILFTSGSEGLPKGVVLTHRNLLANLAQLSARIDFNASDVVLNALPVFHSFGLTGGTLLPILNGVRALLYPSPLHYRIVPALAYDSNATILFGTDTFLSGYARMAHGYDFYSLRYIFAGAERVRDETRARFAEKFGLRILEGYGATEAAPVIAVNTPMHFRAGTVGRPLPGIETRLDPVPGIDDGGRLSIRGPNIMAGYYLHDAPGVLRAPDGGWHDTGDIVTIDGDGFIAIKGRAKRFAKIGGEMVSLPAVEGYAASVWPGFDHAIVTRPDERKGEQLVLYTTADARDAKPMLAWAKSNGVSELMLPKQVVHLDALPVLGTGKIDYVTLGQMAAA